MRTKLFILSLLAILLISLPSPANVLAVPAAMTDPVQVGQVDGVTKTMAYGDGQLYFNAGPRLVRMAVSSTGLPTKPGVYGDILPGIPQDIKLANGYVYVALGTAGVAVVETNTLKLLDVEDIPSELCASRSSFDIFASDIAVGSQYLYVAVGHTGIVAFDLGADKKTLTYRQNKVFFGPSRNITDLEVQTSLVGGVQHESLYAAANNYAVLPADRGGVVRFDITNSPMLGTPAKIKNEIDVNVLEASSSYVFAAGDGAFHVLDAQELNTLNAPFALANAASELIVGPGGNTVYLVSSAGIDVVDVSTPAAPVLKTASPVATQGATMELAAAVFTGNSDVFVYVADFDAGVSIASSPQSAPGDLELDNPSYVQPQSAIARAVAGTRGQAFVIGNDAKLQTIDSANPSALRFAGAGITTTAPINAMTVYNNLLIATAGPFGLLRYQINPGGEPTGEEPFGVGGTAYAVAAAWPNAVVADGTNGLVVVNIDGPMSLTGWVPAPRIDSDFRSVDAQGNYAYVVDNNGTFRIYDLTDPTGPIALGTLIQSGVLDVKVSGNYAFLACGNNGIRVVDVTNPSAPAFVGSGFYNLPGVANSLAVNHDDLYVAAGDAGVHKLTVQPTGQLDLVNTIHTSGNALQLALAPGNFLYVADENGGLAVIHLGPYMHYMPMVSR